MNKCLIFLVLFFASNAMANSLYYEINKKVNHLIEYRYDESWNSVDEILNRGYGDCNDFAVLKREFLILSGVESEKIKFVYGHVNKTAHVVLLVDNYYLDNRIDKLTKNLRDFKPLFSFNNTGIYDNKGNIISANTNKIEKLTRLVF